MIKLGRYALAVVACVALSPAVGKRLPVSKSAAVIDSLLAATARHSDPGQTCVWAELSPPLEQSRRRYSRGYAGNQLREHWYGTNDKPLGRVEAIELDRALWLAASKRYHPGPRLIHHVPRPLTIMSGRTEPRRCLLEWESMEEYHIEYQASFTRPAFGAGYAFVEEQGFVHGTNPGPFLHALRRRNGRWVEVAYQAWDGE